MALMFMNLGAEWLLQYLLNGTKPTGAANMNLNIALFSNSHTPTDTDTYSTYTAVTGGGYSGAVTLTQGSWTVSFPASNIYQAAYAQRSWVFTGTIGGSGIVYGYFIYDNATSANLWWAELLGAPFTPYNNGDTLYVTPTIQCSHGTPSS